MTQLIEQTLFNAPSLERITLSDQLIAVTSGSLNSNPVYNINNGGISPGFASAPNLKELTLFVGSIQSVNLESNNKIEFIKIVGYNLQSILLPTSPTIDNVSIHIDCPSGFGSSSVNYVLATVLGWSAQISPVIKYIDLSNASAAPTGQGIADKASLQALGYTVLTK